MSTTEVSVGSRIRALRLQADMSLSQLAEDSGVSKSYLSNLENREEDKRPSAKVVFAVAKALGVTMADLLGHDVSVAPIDEVDPILRAFADEAGLPATDVRMLASIKFRGDAPKSVDRWRYIYQAISTSQALDKG